jgi:hypothetical protein
MTTQTLTHPCAFKPYDPWYKEVPLATKNTLRLSYQRTAPRRIGRILKHAPYEIQDTRWEPEDSLRTHLHDLGLNALTFAERKGRVIGAVTKESCRLGVSIGAAATLFTLGCVGSFYELAHADSSDITGINRIQAVGRVTTQINQQLGINVVSPDAIHGNRVNVRINTCPDNGNVDNARKLSGDEVTALRQQVHQGINRSGAAVTLRITASCSPTPSYVPGKVVNPLHRTPED